MKNASRIGTRLLATLLILTLFTGVVFAAEPANLDCTSAIVINADTGEVLFSKDPDIQLVPASLSKLMTVYLVYEAIAAGQFTENSVVPIDSAVSSFSFNYNYSNVPLYTSLTYTVDELLDAVIISSACAATQALAKFVSGTEEEFVTLMNQTAQDLGMDCYWYDSYGGSADNRVTARGMGILCTTMLKKYPQYLNHSSKTSYLFHGYRYYATNKFLNSAYGYTCDGVVDGIKTGYTSAAGNCLAVTAYQGTTRVIAIVLKCSNSNSLYTDAKRLLNYGFEVISQIPDYVEPFVDVKLDTWYADAVSYVTENGLMQGGGDNLFRPNDTLSRAMLIQVLYNVARPDISSMDAQEILSGFTDIASDAWYYDAMAWAVNAEICRGRDNGQLSPEDNITRQELVTMLYRFEEYRNGDTTPRADLSAYSDADEVMEFAQDAMSWSIAKEIIHGNGYGLLLPLYTADRAQMAQILMNGEY